MTEQNKILLIEDRETHLSHARAMLDHRVARNCILGYDFVTNLADAQKLLNEKKYGGILTDVFFPKEVGGLEEQLGTTVGEYAINNKIPYVLVTSTHHHGEKTGPVCKWAREHGTEIVDAQQKNNSFEGEACEKNWKGAYMVLSYLLALKDKEVQIPEEECMQDVIQNVFRFSESLSPNSTYVNGSREEYSAYIKNQIPGIQFVLDKYCREMF